MADQLDVNIDTAAKAGLQFCKVCVGIYSSVYVYIIFKLITWIWEILKVPPFLIVLKIEKKQTFKLHLATMQP
jgi:hypothetical protein